VVIIPITKEDSSESAEMRKAIEIQKTLRDAGIRTEVDQSEGRPGAKYFAWERQGVPIRLELGPRDLEKDQVITVRRDNGEKQELAIAELAKSLGITLQEIQEALYDKALKFLEERTFEVTSYEELKDIFDKGNAFVYADWCATDECEKKVQEETGATTRCIPFDQKPKSDKCAICGKNAKVRVIFDKAY